MIMEDLNNIISYMGRNLKDVVVPVFLKFVLYMSLLTGLLIYFFSSVNQIERNLFIMTSSLGLIVINFIINRKILIKYDLNILMRYPDNGKNGESLSSGKLNIRNWEKARREVKSELKKRVGGYFTQDFTDCFSVLTLLRENFPSVSMEDLDVLYKDNLKQKFFESGISFLTALPFFSISILFTAGYKNELKILSIILAVIFYLFIRSSIIKPVFALITMKKISDKIYL